MKYSVKCNVKIRVPVLENKTGFGWRKQPNIILIGDSFEELTEKAYLISPPEDIESEAIFIEGSINLLSDDNKKNSRDRVNISFSVFREF